MRTLEEKIVDDYGQEFAPGSRVITAYYYDLASERLDTSYGCYVLNHDRIALIFAGAVVYTGVRMTQKSLRNGPTKYSIDVDTHEDIMAALNALLDK